MRNVQYLFVSEVTKRMPIYLECVGVNHTEGHVNRKKGFNSYQWIQTLSGKGKLIIGNKTYILSEGNGMFLYPNVPHEYYPIEQPWVSDWVGFYGNNIAQLVDIIGFHSNAIYDLSPSNKLSKFHAKITNILNESNERKVYSHLILSNLLYTLLIDIILESNNISSITTVSNFEKLQPVLEAMNNNISSPLDLKMYSQLINISPQYLCSLFKKVFDKRPSEYLTQIRINKAKELLIQFPEKSAYEIGKVVGFNSPSYFGKQFKRYEGISPKETNLIHKYIVD